MRFNLAPLRSRRDMAMLGMIHRSVLGKGPPQLERFFRQNVAIPVRKSSRKRRRHTMQLEEWVDGHQLDIVKRSPLGSVSVYNMLPAQVVDAWTVPICSKCDRRLFLVWFVCFISRPLFEVCCGHRCRKKKHQTKGPSGLERRGCPSSN